MTCIQCSLVGKYTIINQFVNDPHLIKVKVVIYQISVYFLFMFYPIFPYISVFPKASFEVIGVAWPSNIFRRVLIGHLMKFEKNGGWVEI